MNKQRRARAMTQKERAQALCIDERTLRSNEREGCPTDLRGARRWREQHKLPRGRSRSTNGTGAQVRDLRSQADAAEQRAAEFEEQTCQVAAAAASWRMISRVVRAQVERITDVAPALAALSSPALVRERLSDRILECRNQAAAALQAEAKRAGREARRLEKAAPPPRRRREETLEEARARLLDARARLRDLRLALRRGELIRVADHEAASTEATRLAVGAVTGLADRLAHVLAVEPDAARVKAALDSGVHAALDAADRAFAKRLGEAR